jgi:hypothetical protein
LKILQSFVPIFIENAQKLCEDLSVNVGKTKEFDVLKYTSHSALNMICGESTVNFSYNFFSSLTRVFAPKTKIQQRSVKEKNSAFVAISPFIIVKCELFVLFVLQK